MEWPALADLARAVFPEDVIARAKELQGEIGSIGAYSHSQGILFIRKNVAKFIEGTLNIICCNPSTSYPGASRGPRFASLGTHTLLPFSSLRARWLSIESEPHFLDCWRIRGCDVAPHDANRKSQVRHPHPHTTVPAIHSNPSCAFGRRDTLSPRRGSQLGHIHAGYRGCHPEGCRGGHRA